MNLFLRRGFDSITIEDIGDGANVEIGASIIPNPLRVSDFPPVKMRTSRR